MSAFANTNKSILTILQKTHHNFLTCPLSQILKKVYLQIIKNPRTIFLLAHFCKYWKKFTYNSSKNLAVFIACLVFQILKKSILRSLETTEHRFNCLPSFPNIQKGIPTNVKKTLHNFFVSSLFQILNKPMLTNLKKSWHNFFTFLLYQILKKISLQNFKNSSATFLLVSFLKFKRKYTYKS